MQRFLVYVKYEQRTESNVVFGSLDVYSCTIGECGMQGGAVARAWVRQRADTRVGRVWAAANVGSMPQPLLN